MPEHIPVEAGRSPRSIPGTLYTPGVAGVDQAESGTTIHEAAMAIRRNFWVVLLFTAIGGGLMAISLIRSETLYASRTVIQLPERGVSSGGGLAGLAVATLSGGGSLGSQAEVIRSRSLLGQVVDSLSLRLHREVPGLTRNRYRPVGWVEDAWISSGLDEGVLTFYFAADGFRVRYADQEVRARYGEPIEFPGLRFVIRQNPGSGEMRLHIVSRRVAIDAQVEETRSIIRDGTNLIDIVVRGYDPLVTERSANATAALYRDFAMSRTREQAERQRRFVVEQLETTEALLEETQAQLTDFRRREGLYSSRSQAVMDQVGRAELQLREAELTADRQVYHRLLERLQDQEGGARADVLRTIMVSPSIAANPVIARAYNSLITFQAQRDSLLTGTAALSRTNRDVQGLDSLIAAAEGNVLSLTAGHIRSLDAQIAALAMIGARVDSAFQHLATTEPEEIRLMLRMEAIGEAVTELRSRFYTAGMAEAALVDEVTILDQALPGQRAGTPPVRSLLVALLLGFLVGGAGAVVLDSANQSIRRRDDVERVLRIPGLGVIPPIRSGEGPRARLKLPSALRSGNGVGPREGSRELVAANAVHSAGAEAYRSVRTNLAYAQGLQRPRSIMVTSPSNGEGKTMTAANLAVTFAHQGKRVLLIDADLRRARLHAIFEVPREPGLGQVLSGTVAGAAAIRQTAVPGLFLLPAGGAIPVSAADVLAGDAVRALLERLDDEFDVVIVDSPPVLLTADAPIMATQVDGVLLVVRAGQTERETAQYAIHQLASVGADILGAVLNDPDATLSGASAYEAGVYART
jgi:polysaccharide biosynthesis transport protein